jgi:hypothetical protein
VLVKTQALAVLVLLIAAACFAGPTKEQFLGHWRYIGEQQTCDYNFRKDGTFTGNVSESGRVILEFAGKWSVDGDKLKYELTKSSTGHTAAGTSDDDKIIEVTRDYYIIGTHEGVKRQYSRVD